MIKMKLRPDLFHGLIGNSKSIQTAANEVGISYPVFFAMVKGRWNALCMSILGKYLTALGFTAETLKETPFASIFIIEETNEQEDLHPHS